MSVLSTLATSEAVRTAAFSVVFAGLGYAGHTAYEVSSQATKIETHDAQIQKLFDGQHETHQALQDLNTVVVRVEGKLDVVNQKIDDDRSSRGRRGN